jgi:uncharacterized radical SAM superfamily Fe-S cluster-containing enzyme
MPKPLPIPVRAEPPPSPNDFDARLERLAAPLRGLDAAAARERFEVPDPALLLKTTLSLCAECLAHVPAAVYQDAAGRVWLAKRCEIHGRQVALLESDARFYRLSNKDRWGRAYAPERTLAFPAYGGCCGPGESCAAPSDGPWREDFTDQRGNKSCTVLVEITDACQLACRVCYAESGGDRDRLLPEARFRETLAALIAAKGGLDSVQITGGEASLHPGFWSLLDWLAGQAGVGKVYLPTNGLEFAKPGVAERLAPYRHKLLVLLQFDGTDAGANPALRRARPEQARLKLIQRLDRLGIPMQLTMTLSRGVSERDIAWVVRQGRRHACVRLIAMQPAFFSGRYELAADPADRLTLSDCVKGVVAGLGGRARAEDFLPIPCSHPNCGWVTLFARRLGLFANIARYMDLTAAMDQVAYKTVLREREMQDIVGTRRAGWAGGLARLARRLIRPRDVFGIVIKPFMDRYNYDQDRVSSCCHHIADTRGRLHSFCEYNARWRRGDSWEGFPALEQGGRGSPP